MSEEIIENTEQIAAPEVDYEKEARLQNWVPKEDYRGDATEWVDAKTFVERGKQINPILRANNERLMRELDKTKKQMDELRSATEEFKKFQKEQYDRKASDLEKQIIELREQKKQAISSGDGELAVTLDDKIDALKEEKAQAKEESKKEEKQPEPKQEELTPELSEWIGQNEWYKADVRMAALANEEAARINRLYPSLIGKAFLDKLDEALEQVFSLEKLGRKKKERPRNPVEGSKPNGNNSSGKNSYENLPSEAKAACDRFVKQKLMTREQYLEMYDWS